MSHFKPANLKRGEGNAGRRPLNTPPAVAPRIPKMPKGLSKAARGEWRRIAPLLDGVGLLSELDGAALGDYCLCLVRLAEAESDITTRGLLVDGDRGKVKNPSVQLSRQYRAAVMKWCELFGLAPGPRSRMNVEPPPIEDELERILALPREPRVVQSS